MPLNHTSRYSELTAEQFEILGRIFVEWSNIEFLLGVLLSRLLFTPEFLGRVYSDEISVSRIQSAIKKAMEIHERRYGYAIVQRDVLNEILGIAKEVETLRGLRNRFAHFCWCRMNDNEIFGSGLSGSIPSQKRINKDYMTMTVTNLRTAYRTAYGLVDRLTAVIRRLPEMDEENARHTAGKKVAGKKGP